MSDYETVNNPYEQQNQNYNPQGNQGYNPQGYPQGNQGYPQGNPNQGPPGPPPNQGQPGYPPQNQGPPPQQSNYPPQNQGGYPPQGGQQGGNYSPQQGQQPQQGPPQGQQQRQPIAKLGTQNGQPLEQLNLVMMTGYFQHQRDNNGNPRYKESGNSVRLGFILAEEQTWTDQSGQAQSKVVKHRCQAWNDFARSLVQVQDGTPIKVWGNLTRFYLRDDQNNITGELVDIKINKYEFP